MTRQDRFNGDVTYLSKVMETIVPNGIPEAPRNFHMIVNVSGDNSCFMYLVESIHQACEMGYFERGLTFPYPQETTERFIRTLVVNRVRWLQHKEEPRFRLRPVVDPRDVRVVYPNCVNLFLSGLGYCTIEELNLVVTGFVFEGETNTTDSATCVPAEGIMTVEELYDYSNKLALVAGRFGAEHQTTTAYSGEADLCGFQVEFGNSQRQQMVVRSVLKSFANPCGWFAMILGTSGIESVSHCGFLRGTEYEMSIISHKMAFRNFTQT